MEKSETIEQKISYAIGRFDYFLRKHKDSQQQLHDAIFNINNDDTLTPEQTDIVTNFLNASLSLSFLIKDYEKDIDKFSEYHQNSPTE